MTFDPIEERDATIAELRAERDRLKRGAKELGRILDRTLRDALDASGRHDAIEEDGDGDWGVVWETLAELRPRAERAEAGLEATKDALRHALLTARDMRVRADSAESALRSVHGGLTALMGEHWLDPVNYQEPLSSVLRTIRGRVEDVLEQSEAGQS